MSRAHAASHVTSRAQAAAHRMSKAHSITRVTSRAQATAHKMSRAYTTAHKMNRVDFLYSDPTVSPMLS